MSSFEWTPKNIALVAISVIAIACIITTIVFYSKKNTAEGESKQLQSTLHRLSFENQAMAHALKSTPPRESNSATPPPPTTTSTTTATTKITNVAELDTDGGTSIDEAWASSEPDDGDVTIPTHSRGSGRKSQRGNQPAFRNTSEYPNMNDGEDTHLRRQLQTRPAVDLKSRQTLQIIQ